MVKKMFALVSVTALTGLVAAVAGAGCSSTVTVTNSEGGTPDATTDAKKPVDAAPADDAAGPPEEGTVGKLCTSTADCKVPGSVNDNVCSIGAFNDGDLFGSPICVQPRCSIGAGMTVADLLCDGEAGLCIVGSGSTSGTCLAFCGFDSTKIANTCNGGNKCQVRYYTTDTAGKTNGIGYCEAACQTDADCKGTAGQKCQVEDGLCVTTPVVYGKKLGEGCDASKTTPADCNCNAVGGTTASKDKGVCTRTCITGTAGNAVCDSTLTPGWKCTAKLDKVDSMTKKALFTGQPDDLHGTCALPCVDDTTCAPLATSTGAPFKCLDFAEGKFCETSL